MSLPSSYIRLRIGELGKVVGDVYENGYRTDCIIGCDKRDCLDTIRLQYGKIHIIDTHGHHVPTRDVKPSQAGTTIASPIDHAVKEILAEILVDRARGRLLPFVEGTPIGCIPAGHDRSAL